MVGFLESYKTIFTQRSHTGIEVHLSFVAILTHANHFVEWGNNWTKHWVERI